MLPTLIARRRIIPMAIAEPRPMIRSRAARPPLVRPRFTLEEPIPNGLPSFGAVAAG
jgi:hypothetical protein